MTLFTRRRTCLAGLFICGVLIAGCSSEQPAQPSAAREGASQSEPSQAGSVVALPASSEREGALTAENAPDTKPPKVVNLFLAPRTIQTGVDLQLRVESSAQEGQQVEYRYAWFLNDALYNFSLGEVLPGDAFKRGDRIYVEVTPIADDVEGSVFRSDVFEVPNALPVITSDPAESTMADSLYSYHVTANDADGDLLVFQLADEPAGMAIDQESGTVNWDVRNVQAGTYEFVVLASDAQGGEARQQVQVSLGTQQEGEGL